MQHNKFRRIGSVGVMTRFLLLLSVSTSTLISGVSSKSLDPHVIALKTSLLFAEEELNGNSKSSDSAPVIVSTDNVDVDVTAGGVQMQMQPTISSDFLQHQQQLPSSSSTMPNKSPQAVTIADDEVVSSMEEVNTNATSANSSPNAFSGETETKQKQSDENDNVPAERNNSFSTVANNIPNSNDVLPSPESQSVTNEYRDESSIVNQASQEIGTCRCGVLPPSEKYDFERNEHPWSGVLFHATPSNDSGPPDLLMFCGAVLISDRHALTTSRCVSGIPASELQIWFSEDKIWSDQKPSKGVHKSAVESVLIHPKFSRKVLNHEIAILTLSTPVDFSSSNKISGEENTLVPICLPLPRWTSGSYSSSGTNATLTSWEKKGRTSYTLTRSTVPIISNEECKNVANKSPVLRRRNDLYNSSSTTLAQTFNRNVANAFKNANNMKVNENMLCAGDVENGAPESCETDTGSPLVIDDISGGDGRKTLIGLVSWLYGCTSQEELTLLYNIIFTDDTAHPQVPGVYTRITSYYPWIMENTVDAQWCSG